MRQLHAADLELLKTEFTAVTAHTQASEEDILDLRQEVQGLKESILQLQSSQANLTSRADTAEDRHRQVNIKIRGIPDSIGITELPHYLRRLTTSLLPHIQAKKLTFEGFFCIPKPRQASPTASHNVKVRCHSSTDKALLMTAVRGKTPLTFESSQLTFYQEITRNTLLWRRSLGPVTSQLRNAGIEYRWTLPRTLTVTKEGNTKRLTTLADADSFLRALGHPTAVAKATTHSTSHAWDPERAVTFTLRGGTQPEAPT
ncbi:Hypothetical predicted protein [Pelobates cultripes]|uniref:L1 transposable element RRM domain-containing protein n=1 Tax=Pelobates cultripes TaxID=61616 RepID=A0AAD1QYP8_PELCU|nr:Hypothetical predicted protein [Pelobates cultripes]